MRGGSPDLLCGELSHVNMSWSSFIVQYLFSQRDWLIPEETVGKVLKVMRSAGSRKPKANPHNVSLLVISHTLGLGEVLLGWWMFTYTSVNRIPNTFSVCCCANCSTCVQEGKKCTCTRVNESFISTFSLCTGFNGFYQEVNNFLQTLLTLLFLAHSWLHLAKGCVWGRGVRVCLGQGEGGAYCEGALWMAGGRTE